MALPLAQPIVCPELIGRTAHLDLLERLIDQVQAGAGRVALVSGEAGVGKSRLAAEARGRAVQQGWTVGQGNCFELDRSLPYAPVIDLLRALGAMQSDEELTRRWGVAGSELAKLTPELAVRMPGLVPAPPLEPEQERRRLFEAVAQAIAGLAAEAPALLIVEDLHWADDASLDLLLFLARRLARRPILLVLTYRSDEIQPRLAHTLATFDRERLAVEARLTRLSIGEVESMLRAIFELQRPTRAEFVSAMYQLTDGNPFFVEEVLRSLIAGGGIFYADGTWDRRPMGELDIPRSVQDAVRQRAERLAPATREALALAAVAGRRFDLDLLRRLTQRDERTLLEAMKEMVGAQLVIEEAAGRFAFRHALTRQAIYADLLITERAALHLAVAEALESAQAEASASRVPDLAHHFYAAGAWERALAYARQAGDQALAMYAPREAVEHYTRTLASARRLALPADPAVLRSRGLAHGHLGEFEPARADHEAALHAAVAAGDRMAEWQALIDLGFLWSSRDYAVAGDDFQRALALAREIGDPATLGHSLNRVGNWHLNVEQAPEALLHHEQALAIFERLDDRPGIAATLDLLGSTTASCTDAPRGAAHYERSIALFRDLGDRRGESNALAMLAVLNGASYLATGVAAGSEASTAALEGESALQVARAIGWRDGEAFALFELSLAFGWRGDYGRALPAARQALSVAEEIEHRQWIVGANAALGGLHLDLLALPLALRHLERALPLARAIGSANWVRLITAFLAATHLARGDAARAEAVLADELAPEALAHSIGQRLCWLTRARLALARGEPDRALSIADRLLATAAHVETRGERGIPALALLRGEALAALRQFDEAQAALQAAHDGAREQGIRSLLWRIEIVLGNLHQAQRRSADAERAFAAARAMVDELADTVPDEALRDNFRHEAANLLPRSRPLTPLRAAKEAAGGLTAREREVAALVARGRSNREIAEELSIGEVTVATHISNILGKLDLTSRAQIAAWAVERGLGSAR